MTQHKSISPFAGKILQHFHNENKLWFSLDGVYQVFTETSSQTLRGHIKRMVDTGLLLRIKDGFYYIIPFEQDAKTFIPNWHLIPEILVDSDFHIGYYSALQIHNLITQPSLKEQVVIGKKQNQSIKTIQNTDFQFIYHNTKHFFGYTKIWIDSYNKVLCSDLEKTIIDCLYKPNYAGGIVEVGKAIYLAKDKINFQKLHDYSCRFGSQSVIKRLGFLLELFEIKTEIIELLFNKRTKTIAILDSETPKQGIINCRWMIQQNVDLITIKNSILT